MGLIVAVGVDLGQRDETLSPHGEVGCWAGHRLFPLTSGFRFTPTQPPAWL